MKKIAVLTSGGDASSMNKALSSLAYFGSKQNIELYLVYGGYEGLYNNNIKKVDVEEIRTWSNLPGTKIFTSRFPSFSQKEVRQVCIQNLKNLGIEALIIVGGDGSYMGGLRLFEDGYNVIGLPGTIDNDVASTTYTIGFDSALNNIIDRVNNIKSCMQSHNHIGLVEVMGRHCVDLTVFAAMATDTDIVITNENFMKPEKVLAKINEIRAKRPFGAIMILVNEKLLGVNNKPSLKDYQTYIESNSNELIKINVLGYMQRGSKPSAMDCVRTTMMAERAIQLAKNNRYGRIVGVNEFKVVDYPITKALKMKNPKRISLIRKYI